MGSWRPQDPPRKRPKQPATGSRGVVTWGYIARHLPVITVHCDRCGRAGRYHTDKLLEKYGDTNIQQFQRDITADCPRNSTRIELGTGCAPLMPDLRTTNQSAPRSG
jgi:hypothetical protein